MATKTISEITINNIRIGGKAPKAIHKGSTEVKEVRKGSTVVYKKENVTYTLTGHVTMEFGYASETLNFRVVSYKGSSKTLIPITASNVSVTSGGGSITKVDAYTSNYNNYHTTEYIVYIAVSKNTSYSSKTHTFVITQPGSGQTVTVTITQEAKPRITATIRWKDFEVLGLHPWGLFSGFPSNYSTSNYILHASNFIIQTFNGGALSVNNSSGGSMVSVAVGAYVYAYYFDPSALRWGSCGSFIHQSTSYDITIPSY